MPSSSSPNLRPPRPFFLADTKTERSSFDSSSDTHSDSDSSPRHSFTRRKSPPQRPPPSSFTFPFQAYPGNPDPGMSIPGVRRRPQSNQNSDDESLCTSPGHARDRTSIEMSPPNPPFRSASSPALAYKGSAAANMNATPATAAAIDSSPRIPRSSSSQNFRAPFLSPASRPTSSLWSPPSYPAYLMTSQPSPSASSAALPYHLPKSKPPLPSTRISAPIPPSDKPWLTKREPRALYSYLITVICMLLGLGGAALLCWRGLLSVQKLDPSRLCLVMNENFDGTSLDDTIWSRDVELGGFGNGEFQMTTTSDTNLFLRNSQLYIYPTLTSDTVTNVLNGGNYTLSGCSTKNHTACTAVSNAAKGSVINPVMSARINTKGKKSIRYGKVEFRAKLPRGDWLWPAVWMLPEQETYGAWPASGEIDVIEARGNGPAYTAQGSNFVRSSLNYGPLPTLLNQIYGWYSMKRSSFDQAFHVYSLEWDQSFMRFYTDSRLNAMLYLGINQKSSFWQRGGFPQTAQNGSAQVVVNNPWSNSGPSAPYDQSFYLIVDLAAGGTSGWFPDNVGGKPWYDGSLTAMREFAIAQDQWYATWPQSQDDRAFRIDYIKMWELC